MRGWLKMPLGRLLIRLHLLIPVAAAVLWLVSPDVGARYLLLLAVLLLHEMGHALTSLLLGASRAEVRILPAFGWALVERFPDRREGWAALAGPSANLLAAAGLALFGAGFDLQLGRAPLPDFLFTVNLLMGAGNLLPIKPLDGGRALAAFAQR
ncbi:MAG: M50 family metallopeptidase [Planctomycetota bacterium]|jgi:Zn-dependent protease